MRKFITSLTTAATLSLAVVPTLGLLQAAHAAEPTATVSLAQSGGHALFGANTATVR